MIKPIVLVAAISALAVGAGTASATLSSKTEAYASLNQPGAPASFKLLVENVDNEIVPKPIASVTASSKSAIWKSKALTQCNRRLPTPADGDDGHFFDERPFCPATSLVGSGVFTLNAGTEGQPIPLDLGILVGDILVFNYMPKRNQQAALLLELHMDTPVPNAYIYVLATVSKSGALVIPIPKMDELHPAVKNILSPPGQPRIVSLTRIRLTVKSPKPKSGHSPLLTFHSAKHTNFRVTLQH